MYKTQLMPTPPLYAVENVDGDFNLHTSYESGPFVTIKDSVLVRLIEILLTPVPGPSLGHSVILRDEDNDVSISVSNPMSKRGVIYREITIVPDEGFDCRFNFPSGYEIGEGLMRWYKDRKAREADVNTESGTPELKTKENLSIKICAQEALIGPIDGETYEVPDPLALMTWYLRSGTSTYKTDPFIHKGKELVLTVNKKIVIDAKVDPVQPAPADY